VIAQFIEALLNMPVWSCCSRRYVYTRRFFFYGCARQRSHPNCLY